MAVKASAQVSIIDITDGYSVGLTSEAYTFVGGPSGAPAGLSCTTQAYAFCGSNQVASVNVAAADIVCPSGVSATVANSGSASPTITIKTTAALADACEVSIPVVVDGVTINKKFSIAVAKQGAQGDKGDPGKGIAGITNYYLASASASGVATSTAGWTEAMQATTAAKRYLWMYQRIAYTSGSPDVVDPTIIGTHGATGDQGDTGADGKGVKSVANKFLTTSAASGVTTATSGWGDAPVATTTAKKYLWCYQLITYTDGSTSSTVPAIIGTHGATGAAGADAIKLEIVPSNGTAFRNSSGSTVLTARVYKGAVEQSVTDAGVCGSLGSIKWYKGGATAPMATAKSITVRAADVDSLQMYACQLEG